jgi:AcrR family transcriptional regulator
VGHREQLLSAARRLLESQGYARITARDLVAASGTNLASIGYHFGSKEELLNEAIGGALREWCDQVADMVVAKGSPTPVERIRDAWLVMLAALPDRRALLLSFVEALAQAERTPHLREQFGVFYRDARDRVAVLVAANHGEGATAEEPWVQALASFVIAVCDGLAVQWLIAPQSVPSADDLTDGLVRAFGMTSAQRPNLSVKKITIRQQSAPG